MTLTLKQRFAPLLALLDARYFPLLFAAAPQAYTVYRWLYAASDLTSEAWFFAVVGATGFEMVYVGAIAWAEGHTKSHWFWLTALTALLFSVLVALKVYLAGESGWAFLHGGFPLTAFCYTMLIHRAGNTNPETDRETLPVPNPSAEWQAYIASLEQELARQREAFARERESLLTEFENRLEEQRRDLLISIPGPNNPSGTESGEEPGDLAGASFGATAPAEYRGNSSRRERIRELRAEGKTWKEIGAIFGVTDRTVQNWIREL